MALKLTCLRVDVSLNIKYHISSFIKLRETLPVSLLKEDIWGW